MFVALVFCSYISVEVVENIFLGEYEGLLHFNYLKETRSYEYIR